MEIRSYRRVFDLERRVYSVDSLRLNPTGVPVRGIGYFLALLVGLLLFGRVPLVGEPLRVLPWYMIYLAAPGIGATLLAMLRVEGRTFHLAVLALARHGIGARRPHGLTRSGTVGRRWRPPEVLMLPDGSDARMRALRYEGPGAVLVAREHERAGLSRALARLIRGSRNAAVTVTEAPGAAALREGQVVVLAAGASMRVRGRLAPSGKR